MSIEIINSKLEAWSASYDGQKFHAVLCDPPYGLEFMGKEWDAPHKGTSFPKAGNLGGFADGNKPSFARQGDISRLTDVYRSWGEAIMPHLYPGALVLMFGGTRTWHRLACGMEDAGFEIFDCMMFLHGQGFPKAQKVHCECDKKKAESQTKYDVRCVPESYLPQVLNAFEESREALLASVPEQGVSENGAAPRRGTKGRSKPGVEGRSDVLPKEGQLQANQVRPLSDGVPSNGASGRLRDGAPSNNGAVGGASADENGSSASPRPRPAAQSSSDESGTVAGQPKPQADGARLCPTCGKLRDDSWQGYKTSQLKPAWEPVLCFKKPLEGTYAESAMKYGSGCLNVDGGRIGLDSTRRKNNGTNDGENWRMGVHPSETGSELGRYPANLILDPESAAQLDAMTGDRPAGASVSGKEPSEPALNCYGEYNRVPFNGFGDSGGASRFYYCAKASTAERNAGLDGFEETTAAQRTGRQEGSAGLHTTARPNVIGGNPYAGNSSGVKRNHHPTVKPIDLCRYLATLLLPPDSVQPRRLLVPFSGSGSEMIGALLAGWDEIVGVEQDTEHGYVDIAKARLDWWQWTRERSGLSDVTAILQRFGFIEEQTTEKTGQQTLFG